MTTLLAIEEAAGSFEKSVSSPSYKFTSRILCGVFFAFLLFITQLHVLAAPLIGGLFLLLGASHGGTEWRNGLERPPTLLYCAVYLTAAIVIGALWVSMPVTALIAFLAISAWHFGQAEPVLKTLGISTVLGSFAIWPTETLAYFAIITGQENNADTTQIYLMRAVGIAALIAPIIEAKVRSHHSERAIYLVLLLLLLPPLLAVGTIFMFFHAWPEYKKTFAAQRMSLKNTVKVYLPTAVPTLVGGIIMAGLLVTNTVPALWIGAAAVALATPHILDPGRP